MKKADIVNNILKNSKKNFGNKKEEGFAWAPSNVALCKYWGKRNYELNLPVNSSLSISLGTKGTFTKIIQNEFDDYDDYIINGKRISIFSNFYIRLKEYLDFFRLEKEFYKVEIVTNIPIGVGFASSACGFASLILALNDFYNWNLNSKYLSILARLGSGSACRSIHIGFTEWISGFDEDGMDSYGRNLEYIWPNLRIGMLNVSNKEKYISSREAMNHTIKTSSLYELWPKHAINSLYWLKQAIKIKNFELFGSIAELNSINLHNVMAMACPPIIYSSSKTLSYIEDIKKLRCLLNIPLFYTQDAGANIQLLFLSELKDVVLEKFPSLEIVDPFMFNNNNSLITLVDDKDNIIGSCQKMIAHVYGKLHRAFSIILIRYVNKEVEILIQQRSDNKYHSPNLWSNTCCGHPGPQEDNLVSAETRLYEEMGIKTHLTLIGSFHYSVKFEDMNLFENEIDHVFVGYSEKDEYNINKLEVKNYCWIKLTQLNYDIQVNPNKYTFWLKKVLNILIQKLSL